MTAARYAPALPRQARTAAPDSPLHRRHAKSPRADAIQGQVRGRDAPKRAWLRPERPQCSTYGPAMAKVRKSTRQQYRRSPPPTKRRTIVVVAETVLAVQAIRQRAGPISIRQTRSASTTSRYTQHGTRTEVRTPTSSAPRSREGGRVRRARATPRRAPGRRSEYRQEQGLATDPARIALDRR